MGNRGDSGKGSVSRSDSKILGQKRLSPELAEEHEQDTRKRIKMRDLESLCRAEGTKKERRGQYQLDDEEMSEVTEVPITSDLNASRNGKAVRSTFPIVVNPIPKVMDFNTDKCIAINVVQNGSQQCSQSSGKTALLSDQVAEVPITSDLDASRAGKAVRSTFPVAVNPISKELDLITDTGTANNVVQIGSQQCSQSSGEATSLSNQVVDVPIISVLDTPRDVKAVGSTYPDVVNPIPKPLDLNTDACTTSNVVQNATQRDRASEVPINSDLDAFGATKSVRSTFPVVNPIVKPVDLNSDKCDSNMIQNDVKECPSSCTSAKGNVLDINAKGTVSSSGPSSSTSAKGNVLDINAKGTVLRSRNQDPFYPYKNLDNLKSRDVSECGSCTGPLEEKDPMTVWKEMKENGFLSSSSHGGISKPKQQVVIPTPKQHGGKPMPKPQHGGKPMPKQQHGGMPMAKQQHGGMPMAKSQHESMPMAKEQHGGMPMAKPQHESMPMAKQQHGSMPIPTQPGSIPVLKPHGGIPMSKQHGGIPIPKPRPKKNKNEEQKKNMERAKKEQVDRFAKIAAPSGLLNELNPGIINHVRNRKQVHSIIEALVRSERLEISRMENQQTINQQSGTLEMGDRHDMENFNEHWNPSAFCDSTQTQGYTILMDKPYFPEDNSIECAPSAIEMFGGKGFASHSNLLSEEAMLALKFSSSSLPAEEDSRLLSKEETTSYLSFKAATVASQWLELIQQDIQGRLTALQRSRKRVRGVIKTDLPLLLAKEFSSDKENDSSMTKNSVDGLSNRACADMHRARWGPRFDQMDKSLAEEEDQLESWLKQVREMQLQCDQGLQLITLHGGSDIQASETSENDSRSQREIAVRAAAASIYATCNFILSANAPPSC